MENILGVIEPIKLLKGSHEDTGVTGQGCFMNVIAYLNGEPQITDQSSCVCVTVRPIAIGLNDFLTDVERPMLLPFIERAMGSATGDRETVLGRLNLVVSFANSMAKIAGRSARSAARSAAQSAARSAQSAAESAESARSARSAEAAARSAWLAAESATWSAEYQKIRQEIIAAAITFLDAALPKTDTVKPEVIQRAQALRALSNV